MPNVGCICEFNPLHNGHLTLLTRMRKLAGPDGTVICAMSGNAVQRAEFPLFSRSTRARAALNCGADLVVELPYPWCAASAQDFAECGVRILADLGTDCLVFGSECGDVEVLRRLAYLMRTEYPEYRGRRREESPSLGEARLTAEYLESEAGFLPGPNDRLGMAYLYAVHVVNPSLHVETVRRPGACPSAPSATSLRERIRAGESLQSLGDEMPDAVVPLYDEELRIGTWSPHEGLTGVDTPILLFYRIASPELLKNLYAMDSGLARRICRAANQSPDAQSFFRSLRTKRYTDAHLRRVLLYGLTGVESFDCYRRPHYTRLLGANGRGLRHLAVLKKSDREIPVLSKPADIPTDKMSRRQAEIERKLDTLYTLQLSVPIPTETGKTQSPVILLDS